MCVFENRYKISLDKIGKYLRVVVYLCCGTEKGDSQLLSFNKDLLGLNTTKFRLHSFRTMFEKYCLDCSKSRTFVFNEQPNKTRFKFLHYIHGWKVVTGHTQV